MKYGYVYILANDAREFSGLVKIGQTTQEISRRARNLATGAIGDFLPVAFVRSVRFREIEKMVHKIVKTYIPNRVVASNREFYRFTPEEAVNFLRTVADGCGEEVRVVPTGKGNVFICKWRDGEATAILDELGCYEVVEGSCVAPATASFNGTYSESRKRFEKLKIIKDGKFVRSIKFTSPSEAASIVLGRQANGRKEWKPL